MRSFSPKTPTEQEFLGFDYAALLGSGETIQSSTWTSHVVRGDPDPNAQDMIGGSPAISGTLVSMIVIGGRPGRVYCIKCAAVTNLGQTIELSGQIEIKEACEA